MEKQYKYRIYPSREQRAQIMANFGCVRFVYNHYLKKRTALYKADKTTMSLSECGRDLTQLKKAPGYEWLAQADDNSLRYALKDLDKAFSAFFNSLKKTKAPTAFVSTLTGFPQLKSKRENRQSYRSKNNTVRQSIELFDNKIKLPKLGYVKCKVSRPIEGRIVSATITQVPSGKFFATVCCTDITASPPLSSFPEKSIGIHMGIKTLATLSNGIEYENHRAFEKSRKKISRLNRSMSRKPKDSNNREKARIKLALAYEKMTNQRNDYIHKLTTKLVREYDNISIRNEKFKSSKPWFAKQINYAGWAAFAKQLEYKAAWQGKQVNKISPCHPCVGVCSTCGEKHPAKKLPELWTCPNCNSIRNRNINTAKNIEKYASSTAGQVES